MKRGIEQSTSSPSNQEKIAPKNHLAHRLNRIANLISVPVALTILAAACAPAESKSNSSKLPSTLRPSESGALPNPENYSSLRFLSEPFPQDKNMAIQQGWLYTDGALHNGIDFIKGKVDDSKTWQSFPVLAAANGQACTNPPSREGNAVFIEHKVGEKTIYTYYGHLASMEKAIPPCDKTPRKSVKTGEKVGMAGSTGVKYNGSDQPQWVHLHLQVNDSNGNPIDPYGLNGKRDSYPDPNFINGKPCGEQVLWVSCAPTKEPVASPTPTPFLIPTIARPNIPTPTSTPTERPVEQSWSRFRSLNFPYQIDYPNSWTSKSSRILNQKEDTFIAETVGTWQAKVRITSEPVESWVTAKDYAANFRSQLQSDFNSLFATEGRVSIMDAKEYLQLIKLTFGDEKLNDNGESTKKLIQLKVGGKETYIVSSLIPILQDSSEYLTITTAIFISNGQAWKITFYDHFDRDNLTSLSKSYYYDDFVKMLESFKLLQ